MAEQGTDFSTEAADDGLIVRGEIDAHSAPTLAAAIGDRLEAVPGDIRLYMEDVSFMDSSGLRVVLDASANARRDERDLVLVRPPAVVRRLLEITGLADHLVVTDGTA